jgi:uncharacterized protein YlzI (FlbEa/FlbD family)
MALVVTGTKTRSGGIFAAVKRHANFINLKPATRVLIKFDPFGENSYWIRQFTYLMNRKTIRQTNSDCRVRTEILSDNSEPKVEVTLANGNSLLMKCARLNIVEMIQVFNKHISALAPKEVSVEDSPVATKSAGKKKSRK